MTELIVGHEQSDTHQKALRINLDPRWYGTIAEIGAGQEVVRWFFRVGGAAGTIAKSISAYDMAVSDAVYGKAERYVSAGRLQGMLDKEFQLNVERLDDERGDENCFFAFADTVVARSYRGGNECHGWVLGEPRGLRKADPDAHRDNHAQPARGRSHRRGPARLPGARRAARSVRHDGADQRLFRLLPAGRLHRPANQRAYRHRHGRAQPDRPVQRAESRPAPRRDPGKLRAAVQERAEALCLSTAAVAGRRAQDRGRRQSPGGTAV